MFSYEAFDDSIPQNTPQVRVQVVDFDKIYYLYFNNFEYKTGDIVIYNYNTARERFYRVKNSFWRTLLLKSPVLEQFQPNFH